MLKGQMNQNLDVFFHLSPMWLLSKTKINIIFQSIKQIGRIAETLESDKIVFLAFIIIEWSGKLALPSSPKIQNLKETGLDEKINALLHQSILAFVQNSLPKTNVNKISQFVRTLF